MVETLKLISRIKQSPDGQEFMDYLNQLSKDNYIAFKQSPSSESEKHKGYSICIDSLIKVFETCTDRLLSLDKPIEEREWI